MVTEDRSEPKVAVTNEFRLDLVGVIWKVLVGVGVGVGSIDADADADAAVLAKADGEIPSGNALELAAERE